ncbi:MAG: sigma factor-like helix-turn-helix DNA-binding protein, partial [Bowdeniella nasicola]|nr:sigma factor-like helix-turn-helix DNA-binding protein [Bowdeniella nasicola]
MATWRETFPWISDEIPDIADEAVRAAQIAVAEELAAAILRLHTHRTFGELFSTMATDFQLSDLQVDARYRRAFDQLNVITLADLAPHQLWELTDLRGVSQRGAHLIVRELILANLITPRATEDLAAEAESEDDSASEQAAATVEVSPEQTADLTLLARWRWLIGQQDAPLLRPLEAAPELILHARERLASLPASALLTSAENLAEVLTAAIESLGEREQYIMKQRSFADQPCTLDALGDTIGVTRERVRQIQRGAHRKLRELIASRPAGEFVAFLRQRIEIPTPLATLIAHYSALGENVAPVAQPVWRVLDVLDDSYEVADGWCASPAIAAAKKATGERLQQLANAQGVVPISDVWLGSNEAQGRPAWLADWLTHLGYTMRGDYLLLDT